MNELCNSLRQLNHELSNQMLEEASSEELNEYLEILMDSSARDIFRDEEMTTTAEEFLENSLNVSETSRKLYLHRNTLIYRLDKKGFFSKSIARLLKRFLSFSFFSSSITAFCLHSSNT